LLGKSWASHYPSIDAFTSPTIPLHYIGLTKSSSRKIITQNNGAEPVYTPDDSVTAWQNGNNELVQNIGATKFSAYTNLADGSTISVSGEMINHPQGFVYLGDSAEWASIFQEFIVELSVLLEPRYLFFTFGLDENTVNFDAAFTLLWSPAPPEK
jgi:hypothetical protein